MKRWAALLLAAAVMTAAAQSTDELGRFVPGKTASGDDDKHWQELEVEPPTFPRQENLREFYVSAVAANKYFIDASTLAVGADGIVRYVLVVRTSGGATNTSFEGMRCRERSWKHYATGGSDGTWTRSRAANIEWRPIENKLINGHHAALNRDLFCPMGSAIATADEGRNALRLGKHPNSN